MSSSPITTKPLEPTKPTTSPTSGDQGQAGAVTVGSTAVQVVRQQDAQSGSGGQSGGSQAFNIIIKNEAAAGTAQLDNKTLLDNIRKKYGLSEADLEKVIARLKELGINSLEVDASTMTIKIPAERKNALFDPKNTNLQNTLLNIIKNETNLKALGFLEEITSKGEISPSTAASTVPGSNTTVKQMTQSVIKKTTNTKLTDQGKETLVALTEKLTDDQNKEMMFGLIQQEGGNAEFGNYATDLVEVEDNMSAFNEKNGNKDKLDPQWEQKVFDKHLSDPKELAKLKDTASGLKNGTLKPENAEEAARVVDAMYQGHSNVVYILKALIRTDSNILEKIVDELDQELTRQNVQLKKENEKQLVKLQEKLTVIKKMIKDADFLNDDDLKSQAVKLAGLLSEAGGYAVIPGHAVVGDLQRYSKKLRNYAAILEQLDKQQKAEKNKTGLYASVLGIHKVDVDSLLLQNTGKNQDEAGLSQNKRLPLSAIA